MNAKKCDRCGKYYDEYGTANSVKNTNSLIYANTNIRHNYYAHKPIELCQECMAEIKAFVGVEE